MQQAPPAQASPSGGAAGALPPAMQQQLAQLEDLAEKQFSSSDAQTRRHAESLLSGFRTNAECIAQSRLILDHSANHYALLLAGKSLHELLTQFFHTFSGPQTLEIRNYLLNYIANACTNPNVPSFVLVPLVQTTARLTKLGWRQEPNAPAGVIGHAATPGGPGGAAGGGGSGSSDGGHSSIVETCGIFFQHGIRHHCVGLRLLQEVVSDMENACPVESPSDHRKTSRSFRDRALLPILHIALAELRAVGGFVRAGQQERDVEELLVNSLNLFSACFSFDFLGSAVDETMGEDSNVTLQVPSTWRGLVEDSSDTAPLRLLRQLFDEYPSMPAVQSEILNALTNMASVRRSLFTNEESRVRFMTFLMDTQRSLISTYASGDPQAAQGQQGRSRLLLDDTQIYHEFNRFLARFKYNFTLTDLVKSGSFEGWLQAVYTFTVKNGFGDWETAANSISYLLGVWSRVAGDVPQLKVADTPLAVSAATLGPPGSAPQSTSQKVQSLVLDIVPGICTTFIQARLDNIAKVLREADSMEETDVAQVYNEIFSEPNLSDQLKYLSVLCRFHYSFTKNFLKQQLLPLFEQYKMQLQAMMSGGVGAPPFQSGSVGLHSNADSVLSLAIVECQLSMMLYITGAVIGSDKSLLPLHPATSYAGLYPFPGAEKITYKDHLELMDAEIVSWVLQMLPVVDARIEKSNINAAAARDGARQAPLTPLHTMRSAQKYLALSVLSFFNNFRVKFLNTLSHSNYHSYSAYSRSGVYGVHSHLAPTPSPSGSDMSESNGPATAASPSAAAGIPAVDTIAHGQAANIFSRTAFFLQQPLTPHLLLQLMVRQFLTFLNYCSRDEDVVKETLDVFDSLSLNYATSQQIANLDEIRTFLRSNNCAVGLGTSVTTTNGNASASADTKLMAPLATTASATLLISDLQFLHSTHHPKLQTLFYQILSRLVFKGANLDHWDTFIAPFTYQLGQLQSMSNLRAMPKATVDQVVLLVHKLHGVVSSVNSMVVFHMFFDWFFTDNSFHTLVLRLVETFWDTPSVLHPVLAFYAELIHNKSQRIRFEPNSPSGVILFKETCKIINTYANRILLVQRAHDGSGETDAAATAAVGGSAEAAKAATVQGNALYESKLKGMSLVLLLLTHSLNGGYANFGVMNLYGDPSLKSCVGCVLKLVMSVRFSEIIHYVKIATHYFHLLEVLFKSHLELLIDLCDTPKFLALVSSLHEGLLSVQAIQQQQAANAIEHLMKWHYSHLKAKAGTPAASARAQLAHHLSQSATLLPEILCTLFNLYLFDNVEQHWSLSRPILGLLVCQPESLTFYQHRLLNSQTLPPASQPELAHKIQAASQALMNGISNNLEHANRDKFAQQLTEFRQTITAFCTRPI